MYVSFFSLLLLLLFAVVLYSFGVGRFTTAEEVQYTVDLCVKNVLKLREMR